MKNIFKSFIASLLVLTLLIGCGSKSSAGTKEDWETLQTAISNSNQEIPMITDGEVSLNIQAPEGKVDLKIPYVLEVEDKHLALELPNGIDLKDLLDTIDDEESSEMELSIIKSSLEMFKNSIVILINEKQMEIYVGGELLIDMPVESDLEDMKEAFEVQTGQKVKYEDIEDELEKFSVSKSGQDTVYNFVIKQNIEDHFDEINTELIHINSLEIEFKVADEKIVSTKFSLEMIQKDEGNKDMNINIDVIANSNSDQKINIPNK